MRELDPQTTSRAESFNFFSKAPMPMVTIFKTLDVTPIFRLSKRGYKFNMLMCYCIGLAASKIREFKWLPAGDKLLDYDDLGIDIVVANVNGGLNYCDVPFDGSFQKFNSDYLELTKRVRESCENHMDAERIIVGTSCVAKYDVDGVVNMCSGVFNNPFLIWGRCVRRGFFGKSLKLSLQFHHLQMDGEQACEFLALLQKAIDELSKEL